ncbi:glycosyltransferase family 2 protein [Microvirga pudoricolor]|uniref:glycosyltransferase family 2 protein n=1 Tax=Microvirga pudoricolor TaxID=2778729 RepID=UPI00194E8CA8|nr:glycosyltransferase family 2 protein [Microvirga pudoricolor]MBM6596107.1 glycosyltransferase family 2 protein [Microvirga pudoricolor]
MSGASVTAIVVAFDSAHALPECLAALRREGVSAIVVDNASTDDTTRIAEGQGAAVIRNPRNEGYGRANNIGARAASTEFVLIVNPDCTMGEGAVAALVDAARLYPDAGLFAPQIVEPSGRVFFQPRSLLSPYLHNPSGRLVIPDGDACVPFLSGACFLVRRDLFARIGGFDENIFLFYEDDDLCRRVADSGSALVYVPGATVRHGRGRSSEPKPGRVFKARWHQAWSRAYVSRKYGLPKPAPGMFAVNAFKTVLASLTLRRSLVERYGGSAAGALAFLRGRSALATERLEGEAA